MPVPCGFHRGNVPHSAFERRIEIGVRVMSMLGVVSVWLIITDLLSLYRAHYNYATQSLSREIRLSNILDSDFYPNFD